jgi:hypothetical protein
VIRITRSIIPSSFPDWNVSLALAGLCITYGETAEDDITEQG